MSSAAITEDDPVVFEVATESCDTLRARIAVRGKLTRYTVALLTSAVVTHLRAGRRYLRIDVSGAHAGTGDDVDGVLAALTELHEGTAGLGGMLVFDGAPTGDPLSAHTLALRAGR